MENIKITIIGAGVIGLALAYKLSEKYDNILVLEKNERFGQETSSRNSEVVHSGIYYPLGSLKARLCVEGNGLLYKYCEKYSIPHSRTGKLIVATGNDEAGELEDLYNRGLKNGVEGLKILSKNEISKMEPDVNAVKGIYSENTGIIDSHSLMTSLYNNARSLGVLFSFKNEVDFIKKNKSGYLIGIKGEDYKFSSSIVINAAGLHSDRIAEMAGIDVDKAEYRLGYCKGTYFSYSKTSPVKILVYPLPYRDLKGLGIHSVLNLSGCLRFGPDMEYVNSINYSVDENKKDLFYNSARKIINGLDKGAFMPDTTGIRPKIKGEGVKDFIIRHESDKGLERFINLIGIESPGLTACLSIAKMVEGIVASLDK